MEAWIAGATGLVGRELAGELSSRLTSGVVTALLRRAEGRALPRFEERVVAFDRLEHELSGTIATHVFCCLGTTMAKAGSEAAFRTVDYEYPLALGRAARAAGAKKFLIVTAIGASPDSRVFYNRVKGELERDLAALGLPELHVFRPSLILGERADRRPAERVAQALSRPLGALFLGPLTKYRPIDAATVARAMANVALAETAAPAVSVYEGARLFGLAARAASPAM